MPRLASPAAALGGWSARHRIAATAGWLLFVIITMLAGRAAGQVTMTQAEYGTGESGRAQWLLTDAGAAQPAQEMVLVHGPAAASMVRSVPSAVRAVIGGVRATGQAAGVHAAAVSDTRHDVLVEFAVKGSADTAASRVQPILDAVARAQASHPGVSIEEFGTASAARYASDTILADFHRAEWTAVPLALGILLVVFGALLAAALPVLLALTAFLAANGLLALISHALHVDSTASSVMLLMGLAVGVDYCLFYLRREREERAAGRGSRAALRVAAATSGRSVLVSGLTVMVAMAGMFLSGMQLFAGFAVATIAVVLIAMAGSVTVLPALLSLLGDKVEAGRVPFLRRAHRPSGGSRAWAKALAVVLARPAVSATLAAGLLLALALPVLGLHTETLAIQQVLPPSTPLVRAYDDITAAFPGGSAPAVVVVRAPHITSPAVRRSIAAFERAAQRSGQAGRPIRLAVYPKANLAEIRVPLAGDGTGPVSRRALTALRERIVPATLGKIHGGEALAGGYLAASVDTTTQLRRGIGGVFGFVMGITFILMLAAFGSIVIPAVTIALNLLSVGAAYGVMVAVFQHGWGAALAGSTAPGAIESWVPLFVFVVLFGLSMDYHVFVVSRIKEGHDRGLPAREAIRHGIASTAGVVTSAAVIMVAVFAVFATLSLQQLKQLSIGLAVAVLLDATIIRGVLLPSVLALLGERCWYLPRRPPRRPRPPAPAGAGAFSPAAGPAAAPEYRPASATRGRSAPACPAQPGRDRRAN